MGRLWFWFQGLGLQKFVLYRTQPPSFSKIAAKTIDPTTGASTCALGSHEWTPYSGILMRNAIILASHKILDHVWLNEVKLGGEESLMFLLSFE